ncbi:MAG: NAD-dependent epimerase/dehydratase family protein [Bacillota bacterium]
MQRVLVTGCNGFVGSHVCQRLVEKGNKVIGLDSAPYMWNDDFNKLTGCGSFEYLEGDISDEKYVAKAIDYAGPGVVIHLASVVGVGRYIEDPLKVIDVNILGLRNLLRAIKGSGIRIIFSSTSEIYGKNPCVPWHEDADRMLGSTLVKRWSYSTSKAAAEHMLWACAELYGLEAVVVRYFNLYGPRQRPELLVPAQIKRALQGDDLLVFDGGSQTRCFTYIDDAVSGTLLAAFSPSTPGEVLNIGSMVETSVEEVTRLIGSLAGGPFNIRRVSTKELYGSDYEDIPRRVPNAGKAATILGWSAGTPLKKGLLNTIDWWRKQFIQPA